MHTSELERSSCSACWLWLYGDSATLLGVYGNGRATEIWGNAIAIHAKLDWHRIWHKIPFPLSPLNRAHDALAPE